MCDEKECKNNRIKKEQQRERTAKEDFIQLIEETPDITNTTRSYFLFLNKLK